MLDAIVIGNCLASCNFDFVDDNVSRLQVTWSAQLYKCETYVKTLTFDEVPSPLNEPPKSLTTTLAPLEAKKRA